jgi:DNA polymerase-3 subunit delta'
MDRARTRGHAGALASVGPMVRGPAPHAVLISGPAGIGKTTLALDLAAGLLCTAEDPAERPCRVCRGCRMVAHGGHPDLHRLDPEGAGGQILIGGRDAKSRGIRDLTEDLSLMPMEGGARVAIVTAAHRMNEDAQGALLKTLEEPPAGVTLILCADDEDRLLPTIRSRCARIRVGRVGVRDVEAILADEGVTDVPLAARLARISGGRPGVALAYARAPEAVRARSELARRLLDLVDASPASRLAALRTAAPTAIEMLDALDAAEAAAAQAAETPDGATGTPRGRAKARAPGPSAAVTAAAGATSEDASSDDAIADEVGPRTIPAARRRRAAEALIEVWLGLTRDLALVAAGGGRSVRDPDLLEELTAASVGLPPGAPAAFLARLSRGAELVAGNVSPELVLDSLVLAWPARRAA